MVEAKKEVKAAVEAASEAEVKPAAPVEKEEAKAPAAKKTRARRTTAKKAEAEAAEGKTEKAEAETAQPEETVRKRAGRKAAPKDEAPKKEPAKRAAKKAEPTAAVHFQFDGKDIVAKDVLDQAVKAYKKSHRGAEIKDVQLYIVANEGAAYYVVNGEASDDYKILL